MRVSFLFIFICFIGVSYGGWITMFNSMTQVELAEKIVTEIQITNERLNVLVDGLEQQTRLLRSLLRVVRNKPG